MPNVMDDKKVFTGLGIPGGLLEKIEDMGEAWFPGTIERYRKGKAIRCLLRMAIAAIEVMSDEDVDKAIVEYDEP